MLLPGCYNAWGELPAIEPEGPTRGLLLPIVRQVVNEKAFYVLKN